MRIRDDVTYQEWKESVVAAYMHYEWGWWPPEECRGYLEDEEIENAEGFYDKNGEPCDGTIFLFAIAVTEREIRLNCLEEQVQLIAAYHIYRYENMGRYKADLSQEEIEEVEKDIKYIKSRIELPELKSYDDAIMKTQRKR